MIVDALESRREALVAAAVDRIASRIPAYRDAGPTVVEDVRHHVEEHHDLLCATVRRGRSPTPRELAFVERHAARRARQGIPLGDFLAAFRAYHTIVWDAIASAGPAAEALAAA